MNQLGKFSGMLLASVLLAGLVGCGGSSKSASPVSALPIAGGFSLSTVTAPSTAGSTTAPVSITVGGKTIRVIAPEGLATDARVAVLAENVPIIQNMSLAGALTRSPGDITITVGTTTYTLPSEANANGSLTAALGFAPGYSYRVEANGPWTITQDGKSLTAAKLIFTFRVNADGTSTLPISINGKVPTNGTSTANSTGTYLSATVPGIFAGKSATLELKNSTTTLKKQVTATAAVGGTSNLLFQDLKGPNFTIPSQGLSSIEYTFTGE